MKTSLHGGNPYPVELPKNKLSRMRIHRTGRKTGNFGIRDGNSLLNPLGKAAKPGAQNDGNLRLKVKRLPDSGTALL